MKTNYLLQLLEETVEIVEPVRVFAQPAQVSAMLWYLGFETQGPGLLKTLRKLKHCAID